MKQFLQQHAASVTGAISGWDRLRFRGTLRMLANVTGLGRFLGYTGHLCKDFGKYALDISRRAEVSAASNERCLDALAAVKTPLPLKTLTEELAQAVTGGTPVSR